MSYVSQNKSANPVGFTGALVINGGIITALMFMTMTPSVRTLKPPVKTFDVANKTPPPETKKEPVQVKDQLQKAPPVFVPDPLVRTVDPVAPQVSSTDKRVQNDASTGGIASTNDPTTEGMIPKIIPLAPVFRAAVRDPRFAGKFQPAYPAGMLQREIEGAVTIKVLIGADGRVREAIVLSAATPEFAAVTRRQALSQWRFKPAMRGVEAVEDWQTLTVRFNINS